MDLPKLSPKPLADVQTLATAFEQVLAQTGKPQNRLWHTDFEPKFSNLIRENQGLYLLMVKLEKALTRDEMVEMSLAGKIPPRNQKAYPWEVGSMSTRTGARDMDVQRTAVLWLCKECQKEPQALTPADYRAHRMGWLLSQHKNDHYRVLAQTGFAYTYGEIATMADRGQVEMRSDAKLYVWDLVMFPKLTQNARSLAKAGLIFLAQKHQVPLQELEAQGSIYLSEIGPFLRATNVNFYDILYSPMFGESAA